MQNRKTPAATYGPWLVGLGAALWGTESAWRIPLNEMLDAKVIVFWEHVFILVMFLPILISRLDEIPRVRARTWGFLIFSGFAGSAVGTVFFTLALKYGNPTVVNVVLNIQPVISTIGGFVLFGDRLARRFFLYAGIAIVAGIFVSVAYPMQIGISFERAGLNVGTGYALICALFWGLSTVAGRGVMVGMSLRLASSMRIVIGLVCMTFILLAYGKLNGAALWPEGAPGSLGQRTNDIPTLTVYLPDPAKATGAAIVIDPPRRATCLTRFASSQPPTYKIGVLARPPCLPMDPKAAG